MEQLLYLVGGVANLIAIVGGALAAVFIGWAGIQWMMAGGDPQKMSQARLSVVGVVIGMLLIGSSFLIPDAVNQRILRPATGVGLENVPGIDCDRIFKRALITDRTASHWGGMQRLIRQVQSQVASCSPEMWNPSVELIMGGTCTESQVRIGQSPIPPGLRRAGTNAYRNHSGRDNENNILVMFRNDFPPADGSSCWLYTSRLKIWDQAYGYASVASGPTPTPGPTATPGPTPTPDANATVTPIPTLDPNDADLESENLYPTPTPGPTPTPTPTPTPHWADD